MCFLVISFWGSIGPDAMSPTLLDEFEVCPGPCCLLALGGALASAVSSLEVWVPCLPSLAHPLLHLSVLWHLGERQKSPVSS